MITHVVIFRTRNSSVNSEILAAAKKLAAIETAESFACGAPCASERPVADDTFAAAIVVTVKDEAALAEYANHPVHLDFVENCLKRHNVKLQVFDIRS